MTDTLRKALTMMGYRELEPGAWGKPFANTLLLYTTKYNDLTQWFKGSDDAMLRWDSLSFAEADSDNLKDTLNWIKMFENYHVRTGLGNCNHEFEFITLKERMELM